MSDIETIVLDLNDLFIPKTSFQSFQEKIAGWDVSIYKNKNIQMKGCSPTWAHLMVAGKLFESATSISFIMDDGKGGIPIPIYSRR